ncbi:hemagglutinin domain-containing protein [Cyanophage S-SSM6a]|uniref:Phage tail fiber-like protein n=1 Tax=Synechococcus phage S-SSM7 TaxID=445686 RepID=E3SLD5_9CAUD|nr:tail fiber protein [Synechococcus phage S-SSM7]ADO98283.1 phage tail fiber-like protein [Synechococcus phage S-SSM7]AGH07530.1 hemagglutinin domain-containing protein [Cyanophage S-SSM6a]
MAKQQIGVGSASNDGTGDTLRQGAVKVNANFSEIYSVFGDATNLVSFAKTSGISSDSNKFGGQIPSFYQDATNLTSGLLSPDRLPEVVVATAFSGGLIGSVTGNVTGDLTGTASTSVNAAVAYAVTGQPDLLARDIVAVSIACTNVIGDLTGAAAYAQTSGLSNYSFVSGLSTNSQRSVYSQLSGVSTVSGYATTAGIATLAVNSQGLTGSPDIVVGLASGTFKGDGSQLTGVVAASSGILIRDNDTPIGIAASVNFGYGATVSPLSAGIVTVTAVTQYDQLEISGVSTFTGDIKPNGNITGDGNTVITGVSSAYITDLHGGLIGNVITAAQPNITSLGTLTSLNVSGDVSIGGTLTYEDVTNIDSVGLITARSGMVATGVVTATAFSGPLIGNADTATSSGTATTATRANNIAVVDESTDTTCSVLYTNAASGYQAAKTGTNLLFDAVQGTLKPTNINATGIITASSFSGNATSATQATTANVASAVLLSDESSDTTCYPTFANSGIGTQSLKTGSNLYFNSNSGQLYATQFSGSGAGLSNIPASAITGLNVDTRPNFQTAEYSTKTTFDFTHNYTSVPNMSCTITPTNSNSKILIQVLIMGWASGGKYDTVWGIQRSISGGSTNDLTYPNDGLRQGSMYYETDTTQNYQAHCFQYWYVDTPGTTAAITYTPRIRNGYTAGTRTFYFNRDFGYFNYQSYRVGGSRMSVMEVQP